MIEIEKKVQLNEEQVNEILSQGKLLGEKRFSDTYYDTDDFRLTVENIWLRDRDGRFELKVAVKSNGRVDSYEEIEEDGEILRRLGIDCSRSLPLCLRDAGIRPFCQFTTARRKFLFDGVHVDLDRADFGDGFYSVAEIEVMVEKEEESAAAVQKIAGLLKRWKIDPENDVPAKITIYLYQKCPRHYHALVKAGVIQSVAVSSP